MQKQKKKLAKLEEYEKTLLTPSEIKKLVIAVCEGNIAEWQQILFEKVEQNYRNNVIQTTI